MRRKKGPFERLVESLYERGRDWDIGFGGPGPTPRKIQPKKKIRIDPEYEFDRWYSNNYERLVRQYCDDLDLGDFPEGSDPQEYVNEHEAEFHRWCRREYERRPR